ncbi:MAG: acetyl-CoA carboxylase, carboxyltransferase subunit beta [Anaeroplasma sp.]|uniref:acetyl-CoA carboxylase, carboxyltransferase subunit beta n=1 Tax=Anaeroplasma sp. TaxID=1872523 RepID=UPI002A91DED2|nr:acetyl-CoA carboxylase, carboxyltransferase subunit beta [Anaeroplasma sp.]MDY5982894.1 acetyl-CoA carboxylase, carboxyltransferase subunit beta [Anaeroplasma sp.]
MENSFNKRKQEILEFNTAMEELNLRKKYAPQVPKEIPDDLIVKCPGCARLILKDNYILDHKVCPYCNHHGRLTSKERIIDVLDLGYEELFTTIKENYLDFPDYENKLEKAKKDTGEDESVMCVLGKINGISVCVGVMDSFFMMGSMGSVCGERITKLIEYATEKNLPLILFTTSGGARMQEGVISLFQMAKTSQALARFKEKGLYIAVLTDPTTGGVSASFASLADITIAEPNALIGFAGKRVIERTIKETLPKEFQTAEFLLEKGYLDMISDRKDLKNTLSTLLKLHNYK